MNCQFHAPAALTRISNSCIKWNIEAYNKDAFSNRISSASVHVGRTADQKLCWGFFLFFLQCVTAFAWVVVIYCVAQFCNRGSLNRTLHVPTYIISLTWCSIIILYQLANGRIKQRFNGVCVFSVPLTCFTPSFLFISCQLKLYCTDTSRLIHCFKSCMNYCNNQKYNEV